MIFVSLILIKITISSSNRWVGNWASDRRLNPPPPTHTHLMIAPSGYAPDRNIHKWKGGNKILPEKYQQNYLKCLRVEWVHNPPTLQVETSSLCFLLFDVIIWWQPGGGGALFVAQGCPTVMTPIFQASRYSPNLLSMLRSCAFHFQILAKFCIFNPVLAKKN